MILYHGTNKINLKYLDDRESKSDNDFGIGLYLTSNKLQATSWAKKKSKYTGEGAIYESEVDLDNTSLNILEFTGNEEDYNYLCYLCRNETESIVNELIPNFENIDIIFGPMIKNIGKYKSAINCLHGENISISSIKNNIKSINYNVKCNISTFEDLKKIAKLYGDQYSFKSKKAKEIYNKGIRKVTYLKRMNGKIVTTEQSLEYDDKLNEIKYI